MKQYDRFLRSTLALAFAIAGLSTGSAFAAQITDWNLDNVVTSGPDIDGNYFSTIYDKAPVDSSASTNGYIKYDLDEGAAPGLKVVNDAPVGVSGSPVDNCIMAAGSATCNGEFQSGKRFKLDQTEAGPIDLVFDLGGNWVNEDNDGLYRIFQKYGNNTGGTLDGFNIGLGFGIGDTFEYSIEGDGLSFVDFGEDPKDSQFSSLFAQGLFGVDETHDRIRGYFSGERSGFGLDLVNEDLFQSTGLFGGEFGYEALFGDWMSYSMAPDGYFYDDDGDPSTDAILMAHFDAATGKWIMNRALDDDGNIVPTAEGNEGSQYDSIAEVEAALQEQALVSGLTLATCPDEAVLGTPCLAGTDAIEDLAKFNVSYFLDTLNLDLFSNPVNMELFSNPFNLDLGDQDTFTLRISAVRSVAVAVPEPSTLALFAAGLIALLGRRCADRRKGITA
ncbi:PEP-CTERM sorting domain-containing protein [Marinobacter sp.]|uniref:PEP-CTERM sorting domain-containing protein n=1 Tax=Marinobacter sp. TaxID=50741 RepID=UPI003562C6A5